MVTVYSCSGPEAKLYVYALRQLGIKADRSNFLQPEPLLPDNPGVLLYIHGEMENLGRQLDAVVKRHPFLAIMTVGQSHPTVSPEVSSAIVRHFFIQESTPRSIAKHIQQYLNYAYV